MLRSPLLLLLALPSPADALIARTAPLRPQLHIQSLRELAEGSLPASARAAPLCMSDGSKKAPFGGLPIRSVLVGLIGLQSAYGLTLDIPRLGGENADYVGTLIDAGFFSYCTAQLATQAGVLKLQDDAAIAPLGGVRCNVALSVGREPGTWMPKEWAASGGRLSLPLSVSFTDEPVDLGFPGEEPLGGRRARKLECEGGSFVGPQGDAAGLETPSTLPKDSAPSASLDDLKAQAAPTHPGAPPGQLGGLPWPQEPALGRPKVEDAPLVTCRRGQGAPAAPPPHECPPPPGTCGRH